MSNSTKNLKEVAQELAEKRWGFVPNREIKPIHFANGFFRALSGRTGSPELLHKAAGKFKDGQSRTSNEQFVRDARDRLHFKGYGEDPEAVKDVRMALDLMVSQDGAVFASGPYSFTATHWRHTSSDPSDQKTGRFMAQVLASRSEADHPEHEGSGDGTSVSSGVVEVLRQLLDQPDDLYRLTVPLLDDREMGPPPSADGNDLIERLTQSGCPLRAIQEAATRLAHHVMDTREKTTALQRLVTLGSFGIFLHLVNATDEALGVDDVSDRRRVPLLLCKNPPRASMREASRRAFTHARQRITFAFEEELALEFKRRGDDSKDRAFYENQMRNWLVQAGQSDKERAQAEDLLEQFKQTFEAERNGTDDLFRAFVRAATPTFLAVMGSHRPAASAIRISTHGGLLGPFRGPGEKYYRPAPQFLDMLTAALLEPGEEIPATQFWQKAWDEFGILCGARSRHDADQLRAWGIRQVSIDHLTENANALAEQLTRLGHARTYADGITLIRVDQ